MQNLLGFTYFEKLFIALRGFATERIRKNCCARIGQQPAMSVSSCKCDVFLFSSSFSLVRSLKL